MAVIRIACLLWSGLSAAQAVRMGRDVSSYANTTTLYESSTGSSSLPATSLSSSPQASASLSLVTASSTTKCPSSTTGTTSSPTTSAVTGTCCYLNPMFVGVHTWWSSSVDLTVATAITTWLQYNNTMVQANSTVVQAPLSVTACLGIWDIDPELHHENFNLDCNKNTLDEIGHGMPANLLLPMQTYGASWISPGTAYTVSTQNLTIKSPTPFFLFSGIDMWTSWPCGSATTATVTTTDYAPTTLDGDILWDLTTAVQAQAFTAVPDTGELPGPYDNFTGNFNAHIHGTVIEPFPPGDYSSFDYLDYLKNGGGLLGGGSGNNADYIQAVGDDMLVLPEHFPNFIASIPWVKSQFPGVAECSNAVGQGEPTVHVPVNQLTASSHVTMTMDGTLISSSSETGITSVESTSASVVESTAQSAERTSSSVESTEAPVQTTPINEPASDAPSTGSSSVAESPEAPSTSAPPSTAQVHYSEQNSAAPSGGHISSATSSSPKDITANQVTHSSSNSPSSVQEGAAASTGNTPGAGSPASSEGGEQHTTPADNTGPATTPIVGHLDSAIQQAAAPSASSEGSSKSSSIADIAAYIASGIGDIVASTAQAHSSSAHTAEDVNSGERGAAGSPVTTVLSVGSSAFTVIATRAQGTGAVIVAQAGSSATLQPGSATTLAGQIISAPSSEVVAVGTGSNAATAASPLPSSEAEPDSDSAPVAILSVGTSAFTAKPTRIQGMSAVIVANGGSSATILPGSGTTLAGEVISAPLSGGVVIGTGSDAATAALSSGALDVGSANAIAEQIAGSPRSSVVTFGGQTVTAVVASNGQDVIQIGSTTFTLLAGGPAVTFGSQMISEASNGYIVAHSGASAVTLAIGEPSAASEQPGSTFSFGGQTLTAIAGSSGQDIVQVGSTTLTLSAGGPAVTFGTQVMSEASDGRIIAQAGSSATTLAIQGASSGEGELTLGSQIVGFTEISSVLIVAGHTLRPGSTVLFSGETLSLNSRTQVVVISGSHTSTETLHTTGVTGPEAATTSESSHAVSAASASSTSTTSGAGKGSRMTMSGVLALSLVLRWLSCVM